ncbi:NapD family protein [Sulfuricurvum kujiense DSM 16994]|uniref:Chaperone NapD n=1 Tax=Sulfuricurvum kujiense (strain ATCC BAA-921 / DSM 16994 / JCM 11577 / YK-1) TaxID=709032 RepID=E4U147_SULKY|nr:chaperone NapD [Sulfuricurvum kujiense]ADR33351.1 NapD family protein [Sulfuricurvum kujiense DSM 16994]
MNISSVVVKCAPEYVAFVLEQLRASHQCEVYAHDELGRIIIILEGDSTEEESEKLRIIQEIPHILSAEMAMAFSENEFCDEEGKLERVDESLMERLNAEDVDAADIVYNGDLKDK